MYNSLLQRLSANFKQVPGKTIEEKLKELNNQGYIDFCSAELTNDKNTVYFFEVNTKENKDLLLNNKTTCFIFEKKPNKSNSWRVFSSSVPDGSEVAFLFCLAKLTEYEDEKNLFKTLLLNPPVASDSWISFCPDLSLPYDISNVVMLESVKEGVESKEYFNAFKFLSKSIFQNPLMNCSYILDEDRAFNEFEEQRLQNNTLAEGYIPTKKAKAMVSRCYNYIKNKKVAPSFFLYGPSGTGKSEFGKYLAKELGLPYTFVCCSAMTTESDLRGKPQNINSNGQIVSFLKRVVKSLWSKNIDTSDIDDTKIQYSLTELVLACKYGWVLEIQEASLILNQGSLGFLNCLLDDNRTLILPNGENIKIHPNTVFIFTSNVNYEGCNPLNNALLSRINYVSKINPPTEDEQVERIKSVTGCNDTSGIRKVVKAVSEIQSIIKDAGLTQGISDLRCAISCVEDKMFNNTTWRQAAEATIQDKAVLEDDMEDCVEAIKIKLDTYFGVN